MGASISGAKELAGDLQYAHDEAVSEAKKVVGKGSGNVKRGAQRIIRAESSRGYLPHYPRAITYDVTASGTLVTGEIGPRKDREQGGLGAYIEEGTVNNAPFPHLAPALELEEPEFATFVEELGVKLLERQPVDGQATDPDD